MVIWAQQVIGKKTYNMPTDDFILDSVPLVDVPNGHTFNIWKEGKQIIVRRTDNPWTFTFSIFGGSPEPNPNGWTFDMKVICYGKKLV